MGPDGARRRLGELARQYALGPDQADSLATLLDTLSRDPHAPTAVREPERAVDAHLADALAALALEVVRRARTVADLGSGAGIPGLALAVALPAADVALVESQARKCAWLVAAVSAMGLANARVVCARAEQWPEGLARHDLVLARALAPQAVVLEYAAPLLARGGSLVDWRGRRAPAEEQAAERAAAELGLRLVELCDVPPFPGASDHHLHVFEKVAPTPARFPRRAGMARKRPLGASPDP